MNIGEIGTSEYEGMVGWVDIDKDEEEWRLEIDINGYKALGHLDAGGGHRMGASIDRTDALFDKLHIGFREDGCDKGNLQSWFDCDKLPGITLTVGGRKLMYPKRFMSESILTMTQESVSIAFSFLLLSIGQVVV